MKYIVEGANPKTGRDLRREIDASTRKEAEAIAQSHGMLIADVRPITDKCENCDHKFGRLEDPCELDGHVVCADCATRLQTKHKASGDVSHVLREPLKSTRKSGIPLQRLGAGISVLSLLVGILCLRYAERPGEPMAAIGGVALVVTLVGILVFAVGRWMNSESR